MEGWVVIWLVSNTFLALVALKLNLMAYITVQDIIKVTKSIQGGT